MTEPSTRLHPAALLTLLTQCIASVVILAALGALAGGGLSRDPWLSGSLAVIVPVAWFAVGWAYRGSPAAERNLIQSVLKWKPVGEARTVLGADTVNLLEEAGVALQDVYIFRTNLRNAPPCAMFRRSVGFCGEDVDALEDEGAIPPEVLAGVVAHEIGHLRGGQLVHPVVYWMMTPALFCGRMFNAATGGVFRQLRHDLGHFATFAVGAVAALMLLGLLRNHPVALGAGVACALIWTGLLLALRAADRAEEFRADDFVKKHGLAPGLTSYLENQHDNGNEESQTPPMSWLNTHPPLIERIELLEN